MIANYFVIMTVYNGRIERPVKINSISFAQGESYVSGGFNIGTNQLGGLLKNVWLHLNCYLEEVI